MGPLFCLFLTAGAPAGGNCPPAEPPSFLYQPAFCMDYELRGPAEPYVPQPGDIFLCTDHLRWAKYGHWVTGTGAPQHSGIIVALPDGRPALLEGGPHNSLRCELLDAVSELASYAVEERVWVRRRCVPLTPEQSTRLTEFALRAEGKRFALFRLLGQLTPFRSRGPVRTRWLGGPHGDRQFFFCSELVIEACLAAGLLDPATARPAATYPRDLFFDRSRNPYLARHLDLSAWAPPARWAACPGKGNEGIRRRPFLDGDSKPR